MVARWAHNPKVVGSSPAPATKASVFTGALSLIGNVLETFQYLLIFTKILPFLTLKESKYEFARFESCRGHE